MPPPHVALQESQLPQDPAQSTGHAAVLQFCDSVAPWAATQAAPVPVAAVDTVYVRACVPPPQVWSHDPQLPQEPAQSWFGSASAR